VLLDQPRNQLVGVLAGPFDDLCIVALRIHVGPAQRRGIVQAVDANARHAKVVLARHQPQPRRFAQVGDEVAHALDFPLLGFGQVGQVGDAG